MEDVKKECPGLAKNMKRCNKQMMERRRRERINTCLDDLKALVLEASNKDSAQYSKLEKADILEMTVKHLRSMQRQQLSMAAASDSSVLLKFRAGFQECAGEVSRYLGSIDGLSPEVHSRLLHHLGSSVSRIGGGCSPQEQQHHVPMATQLGSLPGYGHIVHGQTLQGHISHQGAPLASGPGLTHIHGNIQIVSAPVPGSLAYMTSPQPLSINTSLSPVSSDYPSSSSRGSSPLDFRRSPSVDSTSSSHSGLLHQQSPRPVDFKPIIKVEVPIKEDKMWRPW